MRNVKKKHLKLWLLLFFMVFGSFIVTNCKVTTVQAASTTTMKKAYQKYIRKVRKHVKGYAIVNIGPGNRPALLIGVDRARGSKTGFTSCYVYYHVNGKVKYIYPYFGGRAISVGRKNGCNYLYNGTSSDKVVANIRGNRLCFTYYLDTKERNYVTKKRMEKRSSYCSVTYWMSHKKYCQERNKYKNLKVVKFRKP